MDHPGDNYEVNHKDGNKANNHKDNLEYVTRSDNLKHSFKTGLKSTAGESNSRHKLTKEQVLEIYNRRNEDTTDLMEEFGVCRSAINRIKNKEAWSELLEDL